MRLAVGSVIRTGILGGAPSSTRWPRHYGVTAYPGILTSTVFTG